MDQNLMSWTLNLMSIFDTKCKQFYNKIFNIKRENMKGIFINL